MEAQLLSLWTEAVGRLHSLASDEGALLAEIGPTRIWLPPELEEQN